MKSELWIEEKHNDFLAHRYRIKETLFYQQTPYQEILIVDSCQYGRMLINDGFVMLSETDEFIYHEMIAHVPLYLHPSPQQVLIIGGGDGGTAREVLKHTSVVNCTLVEIDRVVIEASQQFLPFLASAFDNPKLKLIVDDGVKFLQNCHRSFDVIIIDSTDPLPCSQALFEAPFYRTVHTALKPGGIVIAQALSPLLEAKMQSQLYTIVSELFNFATFYNYTNLTYPGGLYSFAYASNDLHPYSDSYRQAVIDKGLSHRFYNIGIHSASFMLPQFMSQYSL